MMITPQMAAREHLAWCVMQGHTPREVCESVRAYLDDPTWLDAERILRRRWCEMERKAPMAIISEVGQAVA